MNDKKISVFVRPDLHQRLKIIAAQRGTTIQKMMATAAELIAQPHEDGSTSVPVFQLPSLTPEKKMELLGDFKTILETGDDMVIFNCAAITEGMKLLAQNRKAQDASTLLMMPPPQAAAENVRPDSTHRRERKTGSK